MRRFLTTIAISLTTTSFAAADIVETCLFEQEDWSTTLAACTDALAASDDPVEQGRFILHRGLAHSELGDQEAARLDNLLAAAYRPNWARPYLNASAVSERLEDPISQLRWALAAIAAEPENANAYFGLLNIRNNSDDPTSCAPVAEQIMENLSAPIDWPFSGLQQPYLLGNLGVCLHWLERYEEALQAYLAAE